MLNIVPIANIKKQLQNVHKRRGNLNVYTEKKINISKDSNAGNEGQKSIKYIEKKQ